MRVVLHADIDGLGNRGDVVDVSAGYVRNYLLPKSLAHPASEGAELQASAMRRVRDQKDAADRGAAQEIATTLVPQVITVKARAQGDKLFGSVGAHDIADAVQAQTGIELDRRTLVLGDPIKEVGEFTVTAKLHRDVEFPIRITVVPA